MKPNLLLKSVLQAILFVLGLLVLVLLVTYLESPDKIRNLKWTIFLMATFLIVLSIHRNFFKKIVTEGDKMYQYFMASIRVIIVLMLLIGIWAVYAIYNNPNNGEGAIFKALGTSIVIIWACIFLAYFLWAIYFYNINHGITEEEWNKIKNAKEERRLGNYFSEDDINEEPEKNPYKDETFGLPSGTVRGMIAFTLLFGAIALLIVSFGMTNQLDPNSMLWDQYEFFKTAFLMMIAFYFGSRSLELLSNKNKSDAAEAPGIVKKPLSSIAPILKNGNSSQPLIPSAGFDPMQKANSTVGAGEIETREAEEVASVPQTVNSKKFDPMAG